MLDVEGYFGWNILWINIYYSLVVFLFFLVVYVVCICGMLVFYVEVVLEIFKIKVFFRYVFFI